MRASLYIPTQFSEVFQMSHGRNTTRVSARISDNLYLTIKDEAARRGINISNFIEIALYDAVVPKKNAIERLASALRKS